MRGRTEFGVRSTPSGTQVPENERDGHREDAKQLVRETVPAGTPSRRNAGEELVRETAPISSPRRFGAAVRVLFGLVWPADAYFKRRPSLLNGLLDVMHDATIGKPGWLVPWFNFTHAVMTVRPGARIPLPTEPISVQLANRQLDDAVAEMAGRREEVRR